MLLMKESFSLEPKTRRHGTGEFFFHLAKFGTKAPSGYNPQLRMKRDFYRASPYIFPDLNNWHQEIVIANQVNQDIYCFSVFDRDANRRMVETAQACFANRKVEDWKNLAAHYRGRYVFVLRDWKVQLPLVAENPYFSLYKIPH